MRKNMFLRDNISPLLLSLSVVFVFLLFSCNEHTDNTTHDDTLSNKGDSITQIAQQTLLMNVAGAIQEGGLSYAIDFCNINALLISDSLSAAYNASITRVTDKPRNPQNKLNDVDRGIFDNYLQTQQFTKDTLLKHGEKMLYYKPIVIGMPTCLKCHGTIGQDLDSVFYQTIQSKYPKDKAIGYNLYDLRGMWKVEF